MAKTWSVFETRDDDVSRRFLILLIIESPLALPGRANDNNAGRPLAVSIGDVTPGQYRNVEGVEMPGLRSGVTEDYK
jgi:hypothetical protein